MAKCLDLGDSIPAMPGGFRSYVIPSTFNQKLAAVQNSARLMRRRWRWAIERSEAPFTFELRSRIISIMQLQIQGWS